VVVGPFTNVYQKKLTQKDANSLFIVTITYLFLTIAISPLLMSTQLQDLNSAFWISILLSAVTDALGNVFLVQSLKLTELSIYGPINSFKPVVAMILAFFLIKEVPSINGVIGTLIIIVGSLMLTYDKSNNKRGKIGRALISKGILYRFIGILLSSLGAVYSKQAITFSSPVISLFFWALFGIPVLSVIMFVLYRKNISENFSILKLNKKYYFIVMILFSLMQFLTLLSFKSSFVGYSLAVFQLSSIISVALGYKFFNEKNIPLKLISSVVMIIGTVFIFVK
jgi:drug/metabolite transporter (DMT)-like permease